MFLNKHKSFLLKTWSVIPVVEVGEEAKTLESVQAIFEEGCEGAMLASSLKDNGGPLIEEYLKVRQQHPDRWIGVNYSRNWLKAGMLRLRSSVSGIWFNDDPRMAAWIAEHPRQDGDSPVIFGGVGPKVADIVIMELHDIPPDPTSLIRISNRAKNRPLAITGAMDPRFMEGMIPFIDCFLPRFGGCHHYGALRTLREFKINALFVKPEDRTPYRKRHCNSYAAFY